MELDPAQAASKDKKSSKPSRKSKTSEKATKTCDPVKHHASISLTSVSSTTLFAKLPSTSLHKPENIAYQLQKRSEPLDQLATLDLCSNSPQATEHQSVTGEILRLRSLLKNNPHLKTIDFTLWWTRKAQEAISELSSLASVSPTKSLQLLGISPVMVLYDEECEEFCYS